jgi:catecholate siderophore receptor
MQVRIVLILNLGPGGVDVNSKAVGGGRIFGLGATTLCLASTAGGWGASAQTGPSGAAADREPKADHQDTVDGVVITSRRSSLQQIAGKLQNTAQSINVVPQAVLSQQAVASLQDALKNVPGITLNAGEGGSHGDSVNLRGFPASDDFFLDGLRDTGFYTRDDFDLDAVEVYKGPASTLFGRGSTGGVINQVSKAPKRYPIDDAALTFGTNQEVRAVADVNMPLGASSALRLDAMGQTSKVADRGFAKSRRYGLAGALALGLDGPTRLTLNILHQQEDNVPDFGVPFVNGAPAPVARGADYGLPADDRVKSDVTVGTLKVVHDVSDALSFSEAARYGYYGFDTRMTAPHYGATSSTTCSNSGPAPAAGAPLSAILVCRDRPSASGIVRTAMSESQATYRAATGPLRHTLIAGIEFDREDAALDRYANQLALIAPTPLLDPNPFEAFPGHQTKVSSAPLTRTETISGFLADTIDLGTRWELVGALRYDRFSARADQTLGASPTHFKRVDYIASPRVSLIYKPVDAASLYVSYGTSYDPSAENLALASASAGLGPEKDHTVEAGVKASVLGGLLAVTGAVFSTEMTNARTADPDNPALQALAGDLRVNGVELGATGRLTPQWEVIAGYTHLDPKTVKSNGAGQTGQLIQNTAPDQANLWTVYDLGERWKLGGGLNYVSQRAADTQGAAHIPAYVTVDGMLSFKVNDQLTLQINATNLADTLYYANSYYTTPAENHVIPGPGRTVTLTALASF